jgi:hypothetical protein
VERRLYASTVRAGVSPRNFNHAQFYGAGAVDGNIASPAFGKIVAAAPPRLVQLAVKLSF